MKVKLLREESTPNPERLVCRAARNDYRAHGVMPDEYSFDEIMDTIDPEVRHLQKAGEETRRAHPSQYIEERTAGRDLDDRELWEMVHEEYIDNVDRNVMRRAKMICLMDHLIRSGHWGPLEHAQAVVHITGVTRVLMAQITRHRHASFDIMSMRYVGVEDGDFSDRDGLESRFQIPKAVKEGEYVGRGGDKGVTEIDDEAEAKFVRAYVDAINHYRALLDMNVPQEEARKVLPMGTKVNIVVSMNARAWMHILSVRQKPNVQGETKRCADRVAEVLAEWMPYAFWRFEQKQPMELAP